MEHFGFGGVDFEEVGFAGEDYLLFVSIVWIYWWILIFLNFIFFLSYFSHFVYLFNLFLVLDLLFSGLCNN